MKKFIMLVVVLGLFGVLNASDIRANVTRVAATGSMGHYGFSVTLASEETGCAQYADWWEILDSDGRLLYRRILFHSHPNDQPFTRSGGNISLQEDQKIYIRAHMNKLGYIGDVFEGTIKSGFKKAENLPQFPKNLETQKPLPDGCAF